MNTRMRVMAAGLALAAGSVAAQNGDWELVNPSFEVPGSEFVFDGWLNFNGGNIFPVTDIMPAPIGEGPVFDGQISMQIFGNFDGNDNTPVVFQTPARDDAGEVIMPGDLFEVAVQVQELSTDELMDPASAFIALIYQDTEGRGDGRTPNHVDFQGQFLDLPDNPDMWQRLSVQAVAPFNVEDIQILFGYNQPVAETDVNEDGMIDGGDQATGAVYWDLAEVNLLSSGNEIEFAGGSFEEVPPFGNAYWNWVNFDAGFNSQRLDATEAGITPFDGEFVASTFGGFTGSQNDNVFFQDLMASEGDVFEASVAVANVSTDALEPGVRAFLAIDFVDASGAIIFADDDMDGANDLGVSVMLADDTTPQDMWIETSLTSGAAPAGAERARLTYIFQQDADLLPDGAQAQGALRVDGFQFGKMDAAPMRLCADQNEDGNLTGADFNAFLTNFSAGDLKADVNQDGNLTGADFNGWLTAFSAGLAGPTCNP